jgi:hypothetical protein
MSIYEKLLLVQQKLKAPKNQYNSFGKYNYRSCEDILEGLKPLLGEVKALVVLNDSIQMIGDRYYIKATAEFIDTEDGKSIISNGLAREDNDKKGMDLAQVTGSVSSYARKYALNGLFCIDDTKDSDHNNTGDKQNPPKQQTKTSTPASNEPKHATSSGIISDAQLKRLYAIATDKEKARAVMAKYGYASSKEIKTADYEKIVKEIEL